MPRVVVDYYGIRIYFGAVLHLHVKRSKLLGVQSWRDGETNYSIEFVLNGGSVRAEYDDRATWETILKALDEVL
jgi:hypothetical protein